MLFHSTSPMLTIALGGPFIPKFESVSTWSRAHCLVLELSDLTLSLVVLIGLAVPVAIVPKIMQMVKAVVRVLVKPALVCALVTCLGLWLFWNLGLESGS